MSIEPADPIILSLACPERVEGSKDETRATECSKAATRENWGEVWDSFDRRKAAKAANDPEGWSAEASAKADGGDDMFTRAEVAAE
jgi:ribonucleoside-diphosphate reductase beta chain